MRVVYFLRNMFIMFFCLGLAILIGFFGRRFYDRQVQLKLMSDFEKRIEAFQNDQVSDHHYSGTLTGDAAALTGDTIAILRLDRLDIKVAVTEGTTKDKLRVSAGHFETSDLPGEGNFAIAGHSSLIYTCLFNAMRNAVVGDTIKVTTKTGEHNYLVSDITVVEPTDVEVIKHVNESVITIVTCTNGGKQRLIIRGIEI